MSSDDPMVANAVFESDGGGKAFAEERLPGGDVADGQYAESVEQRGDAESQADGLHVAGFAKIGVGFFGVFGHGLEAGHEIGDDLQGEEDGEKRSGMKEGMKIRSSAAESADDD